MKFSLPKLVVGVAAICHSTVLAVSNMSSPAGSANPTDLLLEVKGTASAVQVPAFSEVTVLPTVNSADLSALPAFFAPVPVSELTVSTTVSASVPISPSSETVVLPSVPSPVSAPVLSPEQIVAPTISSSSAPVSPAAAAAAATTAAATAASVNANAAADAAAPDAAAPDAAAIDAATDAADDPVVHIAHEDTHEWFATAEQWTADLKEGQQLVNQSWLVSDGFAAASDASSAPPTSAPVARIDPDMVTMHGANVSFFHTVDKDIFAFTTKGENVPTTGPDAIFRFDDTPTIHMVRAVMGGATVEKAAAGYLVEIPTSADMSMDELIHDWNAASMAIVPALEDEPITLHEVHGAELVLSAPRTVLVKTVAVDSLSAFSQTEIFQDTSGHYDDICAEDEEIALFRRMHSDEENPWHEVDFWFNFGTKSGLAMSTTHLSLDVHCLECGISGALGISSRWNSETGAGEVKLNTKSLTAIAMLEIQLQVAALNQASLLEIPLLVLTPPMLNLGTYGMITMELREYVGIGITDAVAKARIRAGAKMVLPDQTAFEVKNIGLHRKPVYSSSFEKPHIWAYKPSIGGDVTLAGAIAHGLRGIVSFGLNGYFEVSAQVDWELPRYTLATTVSYDPDCGLCGGADKAISGDFTISSTLKKSVFPTILGFRVSALEFQDVSVVATLDVINFCVALSKACKTRWNDLTAAVERLKSIKEDIPDSVMRAVQSSDDSRYLDPSKLNLEGHAEIEDYEWYRGSGRLVGFGEAESEHALKVEYFDTDDEGDATEDVTSRHVDDGAEDFSSGDFQAEEWE